jgi:hypothetical protein
MTRVKYEPNKLYVCCIRKVEVPDGVSRVTDDIITHHYTTLFAHMLWFTADIPLFY